MSDSGTLNKDKASGKSGDIKMPSASTDPGFGGSDLNAGAPENAEKTAAEDNGSAVRKNQDKSDEKPSPAPAAATTGEEEDERNPVFTSLVKDDNDITGLVAYSIYKQNKHDWLVAFSRIRSRAPDQKEMLAYIVGESTPRRLSTYRHLAGSVIEGRGPKSLEEALPKPKSGDKGAKPDPKNSPSSNAIGEERERNVVFGSLVTGDEDIAGLVAYSIYKQNKHDWLVAFNARKSREPDEAELTSYIIGESTPRRLAIYRHLAEATLEGRGPQSTVGPVTEQSVKRGLANAGAARPAQQSGSSTGMIAGIVIAAIVIVGGFLLWKFGLK